MRVERREFLFGMFGAGLGFFCPKPVVHYYRHPITRTVQFKSIGDKWYCFLSKTGKWKAFPIRLNHESQ